MNYLVVALIIIFLLSVLFLKIYINIASKKKLIDHPQFFNMHNNEIPTGSGIIFLILYFIFFIIIKLLEYKNVIMIDFFNRFYIFNFSLSFLCIMSFYDDIKNLHPNIRIFFQTLIVCVSIPFLELQLITEQIPLKAVMIFIVIFWVYKINCINFLDGLDGFLSIYILFFSLNCLIFFNYSNSDNYYFYLSWFLIIINVSFLIFNKPEAKIFMGDAGSIFLGYIFGLMSLYFLTILRIDIFISLIAYPFLDCTITIIKKTLKGKYPWERLFDYNFLKPVKLYNKSHSYVLKYFIIYNLLITANIFFQITSDSRYLCILSVVYTITLIIFYNKKLN